MFRAGGVEGILCECVPMSPIALDGAFAELRFEAFDRWIMRAPLDSAGLLAAPAAASAPFDSERTREVADCIVQAYADAPGKHLHPEVGHIDRAAGFLLRASAGNYGPVRPGYQRAIFEGESCVGAIAGCQMAPGNGFVLQLAVRPAWRGRGIGTSLLRGLAGAFRENGLGAIVLGVTTDNPARHIYERAGFSKLREIRAYVWRRP